MSPRGEVVAGGAVDRLIQEVTGRLGPPSSWPPPVLLPSLGQCVLNAIYSTGNRSEVVVRVLDRYRERRLHSGVDPDTDGPAELQSEIDLCGGPEGFADALSNHWRAWARMEAPYKTEVIEGACELLVAASVHDRDDLLAYLENAAPNNVLKEGWLGLPGQRSGLTWRYFLMNAGMPGIKADRMITRWAAQALGRRSVTPQEAERLLLGVSEQLRVEARRLDHAVWSDQRQRGRRR